MQKATIPIALLFVVMVAGFVAFQFLKNTMDPEQVTREIICESFGVELPDDAFETIEIDASLPLPEKLALAYGDVTP